MNDPIEQLRGFQRRLLEMVRSEHDRLGAVTDDHCLLRDDVFNDLSLELTSLQSKANPHFAAQVEQSNQGRSLLYHWKNIPAISTHAFKALDWTCLPASDRTRVFHSSGTTGSETSKHWHSDTSLELYEELLLRWFHEHPPWDLKQFLVKECVFLTPEPSKVPHSSLVHMFSTIAKDLPQEVVHRFAGQLGRDGNWDLPMEQTIQELGGLKHPVCLFGTAFLYVHLLDYLESKGQQLSLPEGSMVFETGGYKGKSRDIPKEHLYKQLVVKLGVEKRHFICEYGMSELSSQAYDAQIDPGNVSTFGATPRRFQFPPWARCRVISPETGLEVGYGETGMIHVIDLANIWSCLSVLTEDVAIRHKEGFEVIGRSADAGPRGCSLMSDDFV
jgi:hypothetical protein